MLDLGTGIVVVPARGVADLRVDVLQCDWEVNNPEIEVVNPPVSELLPGDRLNLLVVVERLPQLGDNEQIFTLYDALLDGTCNTLTGLLLVAVVWSLNQPLLTIFTGRFPAHHLTKKRFRPREATLSR